MGITLETTWPASPPGLPLSVLANTPGQCEGLRFRGLFRGTRVVAGEQEWLTV